MGELQGYCCAVLGWKSSGWSLKQARMLLRREELWYHLYLDAHGAFPRTRVKHFLLRIDYVNTYIDDWQHAQSVQSRLCVYIHPVARRSPQLCFKSSIGIARRQPVAPVCGSSQSLSVTMCRLSGTSEDVQRRQCTMMSMLD